MRPSPSNPSRGKQIPNIGDTPGTVKITLETAVEFVIYFQDREAAAFNLQPYPVASWKPRGGDERFLAGPSSRFVDPDRFPHWGRGLRPRARLPINGVMERTGVSNSYTKVDCDALAHVQGLDIQERLSCKN